MSDAGGSYAPSDGSDAKSNASEGEYGFGATEVAAIPMDAYGDTIVSIFWLARWRECLGQHHHFHCDDLLSPRTHPRFWIVVSILVYTVNLLFQFLLSYMVFSYKLHDGHCWSFYDIFTGEDPIRDQAAQLANSTSLLPDSSSAAKRCYYSQVDILWAYPVVLFLWISRMLQEIGESCWLMIVLQRVCAVDVEAGGLGLDPERGRDPLAGSSRVLATAGSLAKPTYLLVGSSGEIRCATLFFIALPKLALGLWITWVGSRFLILTNTTGTLVLKSIALQWFVCIDELLFKSYMSEEKKELMKRTSIVFRSFRNDFWRTYGNTIARMTVVLLLHATLYYGVFGPLNQFRLVCRDYKLRVGLTTWEKW